MVPFYGVWGGLIWGRREWGLISPLTSRATCPASPHTGGDTPHVPLQAGWGDPAVRVCTRHCLPSLSLGFCSFSWESRTRFGGFCENRVCVSGAGGARWPQGWSDWCCYHRDWHPRWGYRSGPWGCHTTADSQHPSSPRGLGAAGERGLGSEGLGASDRRDRRAACEVAWPGPRTSQPQGSGAPGGASPRGAHLPTPRASDRCPAAVHGAPPPGSGE